MLLLITLVINLSAVAILRQLKEGRTKRPGTQTLHQSSCTGLGCEDRKNSPIVHVLLMFLFSLRLHVWLAGTGPVGGGAWYFGRNRVSKQRSRNVLLHSDRSATVIVLAILIIILQDIVIHRLPALSWDFLTKPPLGFGKSRGDLPCDIGTLYLSSEP